MNYKENEKMTHKYFRDYRYYKAFKIIGWLGAILVFFCLIHLNWYIFIASQALFLIYAFAGIGHDIYFNHIKKEVI
jgi:hypothetical protein